MDLATDQQQKALRSIAEAPSLQENFDSSKPHESLRQLRTKTPLVRGPVGVIALHYRHLDLVTSDATRQIETEGKVLQGITSGPIFDFIANVMLFSNGEAHIRRRSPVSRTFAFKLMEAMRPEVRKLAESVIGPKLGIGPVDFVSDVAAQIPARIIAGILGIPSSDLPVFMRWIADTAEALGFIDLAKRAAIEKSLTEFNAYVSDLLARRRQSAQDDFLSDYVAATAREGALSEAETRAQIVGLILAGSDTTRGSLCMTLAHLLDQPDQWRAFCEDPENLKRGVVNEGLRFEPIVAGVPRIAVRDLEIDGYLVPAGTPIAVSLVSALRDPEVYKEPDRFEIRRTDHPRWHPIFGGGAHRCVGEALARIEMEETLSTIARLAPHTRLVGEFPRLAPGAIRQIGRMEVEFLA